MPRRQASFTAPKGTRDLVPPGSRVWQSITRTAMDLFARSGYEPVETPMFEHTEVFERGVGTGTEVVGKQMYTFQDLGERSLTLRPEGTAPVVRAVLEHRLERAALPVKLAYAGPMFRQERPQKGRYRQFYQLGIEAIGSPGPLVDAEVIEVGRRFFDAIALPTELLLNSIGHLADECRIGYLKVLAGYLQERAADLPDEERDRATTNPLRLFDSRSEATAAVMSAAPLISDHMCAACREHYGGVKSLLDDNSIAYTEAPKLVRGLDYYTRTAFEFVAAGLGSQAAVGGGGRYDGLSELLGGGRMPGIGFALGLDRIVLSLGEGSETRGVDAYVVAVEPEVTGPAFALVTRLRRAGLSVEMDLMARSMKGQMKDAARTGARSAVILGADEIAGSTATVKDLASGEQERIPLDRVEERVRR